MKRYYTIEVENSPEDDRVLKLHINGPKLYGAVWDFKQFLRSKWKYNDVENEAWWEAYQELTNILVDHGINLEGEN